MNRQGPSGADVQPQDDRAPGPNLTLLYSLVGIALLAAIAIATFIVLPFYRHRH
ncbi:MAG TPA: hypothetical protein VL967_13285 [Terracidiphilus sp.]|nr:hypothetical protein [Terracidiphilus sp.]